MGDSSKLLPKVKKWLDHQGYPLEMRVASEFRNNTEFDIRQGWYFQDPESNDSREIDVVCTVSDARGIAEINFVIECKATNKPWVLFSSHEEASSYHRLNVFGLFSDDARSAVVGELFKIEKGASFDKAKSIPWLWKSGLIGYSITQVFEGNKDIPYNASMSVMKAATWLLNNSLWQNCNYRPYAISFPIIVTTSPLFECTLDIDGNTVLNEITHGSLFFQKKIPGSSPTCITVINEKYLEQFTQECKEVAEKMLSALEPSLKQDWIAFLGEENKNQ